eukprot:scaffold1449_cov244-Pinguiococcus_pyrenoidosus.AAC.6
MRSAMGRCRADEVPLVVDKHKARELLVLRRSRAPHQLEGHSRAELHMGHILRRIPVAAHHARAPGATGPQLRVAGDADAGTQGIAKRDALCSPKTKNKRLELLPQNLCRAPSVCTSTRPSFSLSDCSSSMVVRSQWLASLKLWPV